jgi:hypothetical protein
MSVGTAYYDLACSPPTFNFADFLLTAEGWRLENGFDRLAIKVLPGPADGFRGDDLPPYGKTERERWLRNIVLPMPLFLPSSGQPAELVSRDSVVDAPATFGKGRYLVGLYRTVEAARRNIYPFFCADGSACRNEHGRYVTVTIRDTGWWVERTSNAAEWIAAAREIERLGIKVVFIPDGTKPEATFGGFATSPGAAQFIQSRAALYAGADLNLGINSGPMFFSWMMGAPTLMFCRTNENEPVSGKAAYLSAGLPVGSQMPNARPQQRIVWAADTAETITTAVAETLALT